MGRHRRIAALALTAATLATLVVAAPSQALIINRVNGKDDRWSSSQQMNISYCISRSSFGTRYAQVQSALAAATASWSAAAHVRFVYLSALDLACTSSTPGVIFNVRQLTTTSYYAKSFTPSVARTSRELRISATAFGAIAPWTLTGVLRHEAGHMLGFRHEQTRPEAGGVCFEDTNWRAVTSYDPASVMTYPQCGGTNKGDLVLTSKDKWGVAQVYGSP